MFYPHVLSLEFSCTELVNSTDNLLSYCWLVNARISTPKKDLPVLCNAFNSLTSFEYANGNDSNL